MLQQVLVILIVGACLVWLGTIAYRFFHVKAGGSGCAGRCCGGEGKSSREDSAAAGTRTHMISSDAMRARLKARRG